MTTLTNPIFHDEAKAAAHIEASRWNGEPSCPHCGSLRVRRMGGKTQAGMFLCNDCRDKFTVRTGTVMERSHVPLHKWLLATHLMAASKKGMSAKQMERMLGVTYKTAWFLCHRIREAMIDTDETPFGNDGGVVECDETFLGHEPGKKTESKTQGGFRYKMKIVALIDRDTGRSRAMVIDELNLETIRSIVVTNVRREATLMTDQAQYYKKVGIEFRGHRTVNHSVGEYVNLADRAIHTNTVEGYFGIFKRGMRGIYQHCGKKHLHRYLAEFDFRYSNRSACGIEDAERAAIALKGMEGKRLTYRRIGRLAA